MENSYFHTFVISPNTSEIAIITLQLELQPYGVTVKGCDLCERYTFVKYKNNSNRVND